MAQKEAFPGAGERRIGKIAAETRAGSESRADVSAVNLLYVAIIL
jgi:hypothetical protein